MDSEMAGLQFKTSSLLLKKKSQQNSFKITQDLPNLAALSSLTRPVAMPYVCT